MGSWVRARTHKKLQFGALHADPGPLSLRGPLSKEIVFKFTSIHKKFHFHTTILPWLKFLVDGSEFLVDGSAWKYPFLNMVADSGCMFSACGG